MRLFQEVVTYKSSHRQNLNMHIAQWHLCPSTKKFLLRDNPTTLIWAWQCICFQVAANWTWLRRAWEQNGLWSASLSIMVCYASALKIGNMARPWIGLETSVQEPNFIFIHTLAQQRWLWCAMFVHCKSHRLAYCRFRERDKAYVPDSATCWQWHWSGTSSSNHGMLCTHFFLSNIERCGIQIRGSQEHCNVRSLHNIHDFMGLLLNGFVVGCLHDPRFDEGDKVPLAPYIDLVAVVTFAASVAWKVRITTLPRSDWNLCPSFSRSAHRSVYR